MKNPFVFFEAEIDSDLLSKYHGNNLTPGVYAVPDEDEESSSDDLNQKSAEKDNWIDDEDNALERTADNQNIILHKLASDNQQQVDPFSQLSPEDQQKYIFEVEPIKKVALLKKLLSLNTTLSNNLLHSDELEIIIKYAPSLSYSTILTLAKNALIKIRDNAKEELYNKDQLLQQQ